MLAATGRILLGAIFICSSCRLVRLRDTAVAGLTRRGLPAARLLLYLAMGYKVVAGLLMILGILVVSVALSLIGYTLVASWLMLDFWNKTGAERIGGENGWQANIGIIGGLLVAMAWSLSR